MALGKIKTELHTCWNDLSLIITWSPNWLDREEADYIFAHLEVRTEDRQPMPISKTGYRSHFIDHESVEHLGGPVAYVKTWLDHQSRARQWQTHQTNTNQISLF